MPYPALDTLPDQAATVIAALPAPLNIIRMAAHAPNLLPQLVDLGATFQTTLNLNPRWRESAFLLAAHETGCHYIWVQHFPQAKAAGVTTEDMRLITDKSGQSPDPAQRALFKAIRTYLAGVAWNDTTVTELSHYFTPREIVELLLLLGFARMAAGLAVCLDLEVDPAGEIFTRHWNHIASTKGSQAK